VGAIDTQSPHTEDEIYVVTAGGLIAQRDAVDRAAGRS
jgi:hypothetical protein